MPLLAYPRTRRARRSAKVRPPRPGRVEAEPASGQKRCQERNPLGAIWGFTTAKDRNPRIGRIRKCRKSFRISARSGFDSQALPPAFAHLQPATSFGELRLGRPALGRRLSRRSSAKTTSHAEPSEGGPEARGSLDKRAEANGPERPRASANGSITTVTARSTRHRVGPFAWSTQKSKNPGPPLGAAKPRSSVGHARRRRRSSTGTVAASSRSPNAAVDCGISFIKPTPAEFLRTELCSGVYSGRLEAR